MSVFFNEFVLKYEFSKIIAKDIIWMILILDDLEYTAINIRQYNQKHIFDA